MTDSAPEQVTLTFSEGVSLADDSIRVFDPEGRRVDAGEPKALGGGAARYGVELRPGLPDGTFTVAWQVVSTDSHPISGAFTFAVGAPSESTAEIPEQEAGGGRNAGDRSQSAGNGPRWSPGPIPADLARHCPS
ncbi:copper resistance CopC family protein, partial [Streptomyces sp. NPDC048845]|uniref:copper resistance CopC family protein n=1 Tax=Streptomyces sp. NPDC048845 TaxID=3155390 RepID=UPI0034154575